MEEPPLEERVGRRRARAARSRDRRAAGRSLTRTVPARKGLRAASRSPSSPRRRAPAPRTAAVASVASASRYISTLGCQRAREPLDRGCRAPRGARSPRAAPAGTSTPSAARRARRRVASGRTGIASRDSGVADPLDDRCAPVTAESRDRASRRRRTRSSSSALRRRPKSSDDRVAPAARPSAIAFAQRAPLPRGERASTLSRNTRVPSTRWRYGFSEWFSTRIVGRWRSRRSRSRSAARPTSRARPSPGRSRRRAASGPRHVAHGREVARRAPGASAVEPARRCAASGASGPFQPVGDVVLVVGAVGDVQVEVEVGSHASSARPWRASPAVSGFV